MIVSNSAGTRLDPGEIQAESVSHHLGVPVLRHASLKPSYSCIGAIRKYFASLPTPVKDEELIVVGDRIFTDVVLANRLARRKSPLKPDDTLDEKTASQVGPLAIWTTGVWEKESMTMRWLEKLTMQGVHMLVNRGAAAQGMPLPDWSRFVKPLPVAPVPEAKPGWFTRMLGHVRKT